MRVFIIAVIITVMVLDAVLFLCLLRASSIESRKEETENAVSNRRES